MDVQRPEGQASGWSLKPVLDWATTFAIFGAAVTMIWSGARRPAASAASASLAIPVPAEPISIEGAPLLGSPTAVVVLIEFSDFECPYCGKFAREILPDIKAQYVDTGLVAIAFRHLPLTTIHQRARAAAEAAECAAQGGKFWAYHDRLFREPSDLGEEALIAHARATGLDSADFEGCLRGGGKERVAADVELGKTLHLRGTPVFLLGNRERDSRIRVIEIISGARPIEQFVAPMERLVKR